MIWWANCSLSSCHRESKAADLCWTHHSAAAMNERQMKRIKCAQASKYNFVCFKNRHITWLNNVSAVVLLLTDLEDADAGDSNQNQRAFSNEFYLSGKRIRNVFRVIKVFLELNVATHMYNISHIKPLKLNMRTKINWMCYFCDRCM